MQARSATMRTSTDVQKRTSTHSQREARRVNEIGCSSRPDPHPTNAIISPLQLNDPTKQPRHQPSDQYIREKIVFSPCVSPLQPIRIEEPSISRTQRHFYVPRSQKSRAFRLRSLSLPPGLRIIIIVISVPHACDFRLRPPTGVAFNSTSTTHKIHSWPYRVRATKILQIRETTWHHHTSYHPPTVVRTFSRGEEEPGTIVSWGGGGRGTSASSFPKKGSVKTTKNQNNQRRTTPSSAVSFPAKRQRSVTPSRLRPTQLPAQGSSICRNI